MESKWISVVTQPLGLAGFALFLVFGYVAHTRKGKKPAWAASAAFLLATIALVGGLILGYQHVNSIKPTNVMQIGNVEQTTQSGSNTAGVQGDVTNQNQAERGNPQAPHKQEKQK